MNHLPDNRPGQEYLDCRDRRQECRWRQGESNQRDLGNHCQLLDGLGHMYMLKLGRASKSLHGANRDGRRACEVLDKELAQFAGTCATQLLGCWGEPRPETLDRGLRRC